MCSQPIEQDAQLLRATPRSSCSSSAASRGAPSKVAAVKLRVGRVRTALNASRLASVPSSRYFAVAGPKLRARRSLAAARTAGGSADCSPACAALTSDGLDVLGPEHGAEAAAAGMAAVVADRGVADAPLPRGADGRGPPPAAEPLPHAPLRPAAADSPPSSGAAYERGRRRRRPAAPTAPRPVRG